jgi:hypothetical protein
VTADVLTRSLQFLLVTRTKNQLAAVAREFFREREPEPPRTAGDKHGLAAQIIGAEAKRFQCTEAALAYLPP